MISSRLQQILQLIPDGVGVADIGTDHAQIPIYLAKQTNCHPLIAVEKNPGPYASAGVFIKEAGLQEKISLRLGSGLTVVKPGEVEWAVIAGMGFKTFVEILSQAEDTARSLQCLILQPMQGAEELRRWLFHNDFQIIHELLVKEEGQIFQIILICSGQGKEYEDIFYEVGPLLYHNNHPLLGEHIQKLIIYYEEILHGFSGLENERVKKRQTELRERIAKLEEVYHKWQKKCNQSSILSIK